MKGYWYNKTGVNNYTPVVNKEEEEEIIGLPTCICGNKLSNKLSDNSNSSLDLSALNFSTRELLPIYEPYIRSTMYYQIADFTPPQYIPRNWYGYSTNYEKINEDGYKTNFLKNNEEIQTTCKAYTLKCKIIKLKNSFSSTLYNIEEIYEELEEYKKYYKLNFYDNNNLLNLPIFTGNLGIKPGSGGTSKSVTNKQNKKYVGIKTSGKGQENVNINSLFMPRYHVTNSRNFDYNWYDIGDLSILPVQSFIRSNYILKGKSSTNKFDSELPFFLNMASSGNLTYTSSGQTESNLYKNFNLNNFYTTGTPINQNNYGYKQEDNNLLSKKIFTNIPYIKSNQIVKFGDGNGILDVPISQNYVFNNKIFESDNPLRYCYVDISNVNISNRYRIDAVYWIIVYLDNTIQNLQTDTTKPNYWYGHIRPNPLIH